jgi:RNA polymerase sigma-70 factor, ECF subfamily
MSRPLSMAGGQAEGAALSPDAIYRRYYGPVLGYLYQLCGSADLAEDLAQETFLKVCAGLLSFRGESSLATWLFRIARNTYLNSLRRPSAPRIDTDELLAIPAPEGEGDPAQSYAARERRTQIAAAMGSLPEKQRSILLLRDAEGLSYLEIAEILGVSLAAVKVNLFRARNAFRVAYAALGAEEG